MSKENKSTSKTKPLSPREQKFVEEYLLSLKPEAAGRKAGYAESTCKSQIYTWTSESKCPAHKRHVFNAIQAAKAKRSEETKIDANWVLTELKGMWEANLNDILCDDGTVKPVSEWPSAWLKQINGFEIAEIYEQQEQTRMHVGDLKKIKWIAREKILDMIAKHVDVQAFREKVEVEVTDKRAALAAARERALGRK